jgi:hypothetical protein
MRKEKQQMHVILGKEKSGKTQKLLEWALQTAGKVEPAEVVIMSYDEPVCEVFGRLVRCAGVYKVCPHNITLVDPKAFSSVRFINGVGALALDMPMTTFNEMIDGIPRVCYTVQAQKKLGATGWVEYEEEVARSLADQNKKWSIQPYTPGARYGMIKRENITS